MKRTPFVSSVVLLCFVVLNLAGHAQPSKPDPAPTKLDVFVGSWTFQWNTKASIFGPAGTITGVERNQWLPGRFFLRMERDAKGQAGDFSNLGLFGYDPGLKKHTQSIFNLTNGWSGEFVETVSGNAWMWTGSGDIAGTRFQQRSTLTIAAEAASRAMKCEVGTDSGKTWSITEEGRYTRSR